MVSEIQPELSLSARLEALLFVAPGPVTITQLADALQVSPRKVENGLDELNNYYVDQGARRGLRLQRHLGTIQLTTAPETSDLIESFLELEIKSRLSQAALEVLAIIAYRRPVTRPQIDSIRGVNSDSALKSLLSKGLIQEVGRSSAPGRPILYSVTSEFLQYFGLNSLEELPPLEIEENDSSSFQNTQDENEGVYT